MRQEQQERAEIEVALKAKARTTRSGGRPSPPNLPLPDGMDRDEEDKDIRDFIASDDKDDK